MAGIRKSGNQDDIPRGLFARAGYYRIMGDYQKAWGDVSEAREIAERGEMGRWMVDVLLEKGRIYSAMGEKGKARKCGEEARGQAITGETVKRRHLIEDSRYAQHGLRK